MSSAVRAIRSDVHPDAVRIVALAAAISLNVLVLLMALRPIAQVLRPHVDARTPLTVDFLETRPKPLVVPPPPPIDLPIRKPRSATRAPIAPPPTVAVDEPGQNAVAAPVPVLPVTDATPVPTTPTAPEPPSTLTGDTTLAYINAPPPIYPTAARRAFMEGTVILRVLVDAAGQPRQVEILQSSGHGLLDRTAQRQVLAHWRFRPAQVNGRTVRAWARVPVTFDLQRR